MLIEVTRSHIDAWIISRQKFVSIATVRREANTIRNAFKIAKQRWDWISINPFEGARELKDSPPRDRILTWQEIKLLLKAFKYSSKAEMNTKTQEVGICLMIGLRTALRAGEILQLGNSNVNFKKSIITIENHKTRHKTGKARVVPVSESASKLLKKLPNRERYFTCTSQKLDVLFRRVRDRVGLKDIHFHDSRATALTILSKVLNPLDLAKVSGHKDLNILMNTYYREKPEDIALKMTKVSIRQKR